MKDIKRVHICGTNGSGKSTLGELISERLKIPFYSLGDVKYVVKYSKKRSEAEMRKKIRKISLKKKWITEESWGERAEELFKKADLIVLLKIPKTICQYRIIKRFLKREKQENDNLKQAFRLCRKVRRYDKDNHPTSLKSQFKLIKKYNKKTKIIKNKKELNKFLDSLK